ncbi:MAG TPA: hypothetical protein VFI05_09040 [Nitrospiraceae bacterium]|nr:hypothetical protein [Nitrospiraceae bacterium]
MDIRLTVMMSIFATVLVVSGCASTEETRPASGPSMKELPSAKEMPSGKMRETPPPTVTKEPTPAAPGRTAPSVTETRTVTSGDPLQACLQATSKGASPGQRAIAELTCERDFGKGDARPVASGTQGDTLQGCLARIPKDASAGQRMIAEQSCQRDEEIRKGF